MEQERDYVLGTHDEEIERLGLQHRIWRPTVLRAWAAAGVNIGQRILDLGAGPGYASIDLAEIVGRDGKVVALERSQKFVNAARAMSSARALENLEIHELDLMTDEFPEGDFDIAWCRWVATFVSDPALLVQKIARALKPRGTAIFLEYAHYLTWRYVPRAPAQEEMARKVAQSWRETGGEPDIAYRLLPLLTANGFRLRSVVPHIFCVRPNEFMWQWATTFIEIGLARLLELGRIDERLAADVRREIAAATNDPAAYMVTPMVFEIVADRQGE